MVVGRRKAIIIDTWKCSQRSQFATIPVGFPFFELQFAKPDHPLLVGALKQLRFDHFRPLRRRRVRKHANSGRRQSIVISA